MIIGMRQLVLGKVYNMNSEENYEDNSFSETPESALKQTDFVDIEIKRKNLSKYFKREISHKELRYLEDKGIL